MLRGMPIEKNTYAHMHMNLLLKYGYRSPNAFYSRFFFQGFGLPMRRKESEPRAVFERAKVDAALQLFASISSPQGRLKRWIISKAGG
jgi:hypothetical protein